MPPPAFPVQNHRKFSQILVIVFPTAEGNLISGFDAVNPEFFSDAEIRIEGSQWLVASGFLNSPVLQ